MIIAGPNEEQFRFVCGFFRTLQQTFSEALVVAFGGPQAQFWAKFQQIEACSAAIDKPLRNRCLSSQTVIEIENIQRVIYPIQSPPN